MNQSRPSTFRRSMIAVGSIITGVLLVVGVPIALWRMVGWPLPTTVPTPGDIGKALSRSTVSDTVIIKSLALVGWFAWLALMWSLVIEIGARLTGRQARTMRFAGPFQDVARRLVTAASLLTVSAAPLMTSTPALAAVGAPALIVERNPVPVGATAPRVAPAVVREAPEAPPSASSSTYSVKRRDSLWRIAECQLGDPMRWREIWDLNRGREFDGVAFTDANLIRPGWVLALPQALAHAAPEQDDSPAPTRDDPVAPPTTIESAAVIEAPTTMAPASSESEGVTTTIAPDLATSTPVTSTPEAERVEASLGDSADDEEIVVPMFVGGTVLATGLLLLLRRLRRTQARRRPSGDEPHRPPTTTAPIETAIRHDANTDLIDRLFTAARAFSVGVEPDSPLPDLAAARVSGSEVEILLSAAASSNPPGFEDRGKRRAFATEEGISTAALAGIAGDAATPWPTLVAAGGLGDDLVLIDLESAGMLTVDGDRAGDTTRRIAAELAASPASELVDVLVLGDVTALTASDRVRPIATVDEAVAVLKAAVESTRSALDLLGVPDTPTARGRHSAQHAWGVTVLISAAPLAPTDFDRLATLVQPHCGVAVVVPAPPMKDTWSLSVDDSAVLQPHGFELTPLDLPAVVLESIDSLLADAAVGDAESALLGQADDPAAPDEPIHLPEFGAADVDAAEEPEVEIRVLGPVQVHGVPPINRRRTVELIAHLALHPNGVTGSQLKTAIWPDTIPSQDTFNVTVHRARSGLGVSRDGTHHLPHAVTNGSSYSLGAHVTSDLARFTDLAARSRSAIDPVDEAELLKQALELLRGQPFEGSQGYEWAYTEGIVVESEALIADTAHRLAQLALASGDSALATWAATQGLMAVPGSEPLYRDRMEAAHLNGDPAAVDRIVDELCRYVETLDPLDDLHPDTIALWRRVGRPSSSRSPESRC
jgi:hypothetical protein